MEFETSNVKLFSGRATNYLAEKIAKSYGTQLGNLSVQKFTDGELGVSFEESVRGFDVFLIQSIFQPSENLMELLMMIDAAKRASANTVSVVIPYFGYARQDRKDRPRVAIGAKLVANLLSAAGTDRIMTCDLHAGQIQAFFDFPVDHLDGSALFVPYIKNLGLDNLTIGSPDVGGLKRARAYAKHFNVDLIACDKHRERANEVANMQLIGNVKGKNVIILDDLIDTAGTMTRAANLIMEEGAKSVRAFCTHPILSGEAYNKIENSRLEEMVVTDTIPMEKETSKIKVISCADLFALAIRKLNEKGSISSLFIS